MKQRGKKLDNPVKVKINKSLNKLDGALMNSKKLDEANAFLDRVGDLSKFKPSRHTR